MTASGRLLIGVDVGTTSVKGVAIDEGGTIVAEQAAVGQLVSLHPGWAEMDPAEWWRNTIAVIRGLLGSPGVDPGAVAAVGVSGMVPALVILDQDGNPLRLSIQQNDARTATELDWMRGAVDRDEFFRITGGSVNQQLIAPKLEWLRRNEPAVMQAAHRLLGSYDYMAYRLTGSLGVEANWALESGFAGLATASWHLPYLDLAGIGPEMLPPIRMPADLAGTVTAVAARETGLLPGTPVVAGCADHVASAFAAGLVHQGDLNIKFGGAGDILFCLDGLDTDPRLFIDYHLVPGKYLINGCMAASGSLVKWFVQGFGERFGGVGARPDLLDAEAACLEPGPDSLVVLPYFIGEKTPIHDPTARGVVLGLTLHHGPEHVHRAILESVVFGFRHHLDVLAERGHLPRRVVATDGGARSRLWRQIAADILGFPVEYQAKHPGSALGAAFVAGMGTGVFGDWAEIGRFVRVTDVVDPRPRHQPAYDDLYGIYRDLYRSVKPLFGRLAATGRAGRPGRT